MADVRVGLCMDHGPLSRACQRLHLTDSINLFLYKRAIVSRHRKAAVICLAGKLGAHMMDAEMPFRDRHDIGRDLDARPGRPDALGLPLYIQPT